MFIFAPAAAAESRDAPQVADKSPVVSSVQSTRLPIYQPPKVGKPTRTIGGGSRGPGDGISELYVLVPAHVGQTASEQPSLFWYIDEVPDIDVRLEFTLLDEDGLDPLVLTTLAKLERAGIHRIRLSDYGVKLAPGVEYEWSVSLIPDENARAKDIVSTGWIDRVDAPTGMDGSDVHILASNGLWYDALTVIDERIAAEPEDKELVEMRTALLRQVGLDDVAKSLQDSGA